MGINLISLLWTDGEAHWPCDFRIYDKPADGLSKNDHFVAMLKMAATRGFEPSLVAFDSWYASLDNLKPAPSSPGTVHLKGYGFIKVFKM
jgi:hypothetical protein